MLQAESQFSEDREQYLIGKLALPQAKYRGGHLIFDIETGPLSEETIRSRSIPFQPPPHPGEFDESSVKLGNLKDKLKIYDKIQLAKRAHSTLVENYAADCQRLEAEYWAGIIDRAALSPLLGRVLAIGIGCEDGANHYLCVNENTDHAESWLLEQFWQHWYWPCFRDGNFLIGHNILEFDVPFIVRRSWLLGVDMPTDVFRGKYPNPLFVDTSVVWRCGSRSADYIKLDALGKALGVGGKLDDVDGDGNKVDGAAFARLYFGTSEERGKALDYLEGDVNLTRKVAMRLGLV